MGTRDHARIDVLWGEPGEQVFYAALRAQAEDFARCVRDGGTGVGASAADARRTLELAQLATEARSPLATEAGPPRATEARSPLATEAGPPRATEARSP
jgi:predicted dehydrogenase